MEKYLKDFEEICHQVRPQLNSRTPDRVPEDILMEPQKSSAPSSPGLLEPPEGFRDDNEMTSSTLGGGEGIMETISTADEDIVELFVDPKELEQVMETEVESSIQEDIDNPDTETTFESTEVSIKDDLTKIINSSGEWSKKNQEKKKRVSKSLFGMKNL